MASKASEWAVPQPWLTPDCNDYRCRKCGQCVFDRPQCLEFLRAHKFATFDELTP